MKTLFLRNTMDINDWVYYEDDEYVEERFKELVDTQFSLLIKDDIDFRIMYGNNLKTLMYMIFYCSNTKTREIINNDIDKIVNESSLRKRCIRTILFSWKYRWFLNLSK